LSAIRRITNETPAGFGARDDSFFLARYGRQSMSGWLSSQ
jgi:hypothetical protein